MTEGKIRPQDKGLMQPGMEYSYIDCDIDYTKLTATVRIAIFDLEHYRDEVRHNVTESDLAQIVAAHENEGWQHTRGEHGRAYEGHYFQCPKG